MCLDCLANARARYLPSGMVSSGELKKARGVLPNLKRSATRTTAAIRTTWAVRTIRVRSDSAITYGSHNQPQDRHCNHEHSEAQKNRAQPCQLGEHPGILLLPSVGYLRAVSEK